MGMGGEAVPWPPRWRPWPARERRGGSNAWDSAERGAAALASAADDDDDDALLSINPSAPGQAAAVTLGQAHVSRQRAQRLQALHVSTPAPPYFPASEWL